jgi:hypothetical protein
MKLLPGGFMPSVGRGFDFHRPLHKPCDAVEFTCFPPPKFPITTRVLDVVGRGFRRSGHLGRDDSGSFHFSDYDVRT